MEHTGVCPSPKIPSWLQRSNWPNHALTARRRKGGEHGPQLPCGGKAPPSPRPRSLEISPSPGGLGRSWNTLNMTNVYKCTHTPAQAPHLTALLQLYSTSPSLLQLFLWPIINNMFESLLSLKILLIHQLTFPYEESKSVLHLPPTLLHHPLTAHPTAVWHLPSQPQHCPETIILYKVSHELRVIHSKVNVPILMSLGC